MMRPNTSRSRNRSSWIARRNSRWRGSKRFFKFRISDEAFDEALKSNAGADSSSTKELRRLRPWFWPSIADAGDWVRSEVRGKYDPLQYLRTEPRPLLAHLIQRIPSSESVLDLGCNSGADLNLLYQEGFRKLYGVDASGAALGVFASKYPETFRCAEVRHELFQRYLMRSPDRFVDVLHSHGATLELIHPSFPLVSEICRVVRKAVFIDVLEEGHAYPRDYIREFERNGFRLVYCQRDPQLFYSSLLEFRRIQ